MAEQQGLIDRAKAWRDADPDPVTQAELQALIEKADLSELGRRFLGPLEFGTAGLRGVIGAGESRMNLAVVCSATAALCRVLTDKIAKSAEKGLVIGFDARTTSRELAAAAGQVATARGFRVWLAAEYTPTPFVAYCLKKAQAAAGIVITASHNPAEYNGYKVYWQNGAQIIPPVDSWVREAEAQGKESAKVIFEAATKSPARAQTFPSEWRQSYLEEARALRVQPEISLAGLRIGYTPMHGVGGPFVVDLLKAAGVRELSLVSSQFEPDGTFPTVRFPNPEEPGAMDRLLSLGQASQADVLFANDPDADRLAVAVRDRGANGEARFRVLTGNEVGTLLGAYLLSQRQRGAKQALVLASVVSSTELSAIAEKRGALYQETLTGFKWIANAAMAKEAQTPGVDFVFGYEEALGYTVGTLVRDKDGISATLLFAELVAWLQRDGKTIADYQLELATELGLFSSRQKSLALGNDAARAWASTVLARLTAKPPSSLASTAITKVTDYRQGQNGLPPADLIALSLAGGGRILLRPSGTEPKFKIYLEVRQPLAPGATWSDYEATEQSSEALIDRLQIALLELLAWPG